MEPARWTDWLEERLEHWAIPRLVRSFIVLNALVFILTLLTPTFTQSLVLHWDSVEHGEFWRLLTFMVVPSESGVLWFLLYLYFLWWVGSALESDWGAFKINLYFFVGMISLWIVSYLYPHGVIPQTFLMGSLIVAFGTSFPDEQIFLFPIPIAIKAKFIAMFSAAMMVFSGFKLWPVLLASFLPYLLFFVPTYLKNRSEKADSRKRMDRFRGDGRD